MPRIQFPHQTVPTETTLHLGPHGFVDAVFLLALFDSSFGYIHDVGPGDALRRSSCGASHHCDADRFSSLQPQSCPPHSSHSPNSASLVVAFLCRNSVSPLVRSYHLSSCLKQPFSISTIFFDHFSSFATAVTTQSALLCDSVASSPECVFPLRWFTRRTFFSTRLGCAFALPLQTGIFPSHLGILLFSNFIKNFPLDLRSSFTESSFQDAPRASLDLVRGLVILVVA